MGGEHRSIIAASNGNIGSSPRGRGTQQSQVDAVAMGRIIPAWAGNTLTRTVPTFKAADHPRVGGEHDLVAEFFKRDTGSSPRGRGTPARGRSALSRFRIIPAWAGNTQACRLDCDGRADHPRVGGEHMARPRIIGFAPGSSPRGRGTRLRRRIDSALRRIIPAWAGNTSRPPPARDPATDHPRVGGEHRRQHFCHQRNQRIIPAWAGNTGGGKPCPAHQTDHPRVGGEHVLDPSQADQIVGSSPRGRGTL